MLTVTIRGLHVNKPIQRSRAHSSIAVWWLRSASVPLSAAAVLDHSEFSRFKSFRCAGSARDYLAAHVVTRVALAEKLSTRPEQVVFTRSGVHSKPYVSGFDIHFSLSHSHGLGLAAISEVGPVGIDSEYRGRPYSEQLLRRILANNESCAIPDNPGVASNMLLSKWTQKEAVLKALGTGLAIDPRELIVAEDCAVLFPSRPNEVQLSMWCENFCIGYDHICAMASTVPFPDSQINCIEVTPELIRRSIESLWYSTVED